MTKASSDIRQSIIVYLHYERGRVAGVYNSGWKSFCTPRNLKLFVDSPATK
jgi:hypothetical protein